MRLTSQPMFKHLLRAALLLVVLAALTGSVFAQNTSVRLDINRGVENGVWKIEGEKTLVMNGFDLTPTTLQFPVAIESVTIDVSSATPNSITDVVIYEDPNGGSPADATLVGTQQIALDRNGVYVAQLRRPVIVNSPVVWAGFYMPVNTEFRADKQGSSVLSYWAWSPGSTFDLRSLSSAGVFGPSDGSGPVNLDIGGVARITVYARTANNADLEESEAVVNEDLTLDEAQAAARYLRNYDTCPSLFYDTGDLDISLRSTIRPRCREVETWNAPPAPTGYLVRGRDGFTIYDITFYNDDGGVLSESIPIAVTHCVAPPKDAQGSAVMAVAYGSPRRWDLLESAQFDNLLCAEVRRGGNLAYLIPN
jgi:hypothetical protein